MISVAVQKQRDYFRTGATIPIASRKERLRSLRNFITENTDALCDAVYKDLRRQPTVTQMMEIGTTVQEIDYMLGHLDDWAKPTHVDRTFVNALDHTLITKDPLGVVLIISPWNYPVSLILLPLIPAIAAGNTIIIKPSEVSANVSAVFEKLMPKYFEPEFCKVIGGGVSETTELLKERFDHIVYTGSPGIAKVIMSAAAKNLTPVTLELGGKCPVVVEDGVDFDIVAKRIAWGKWMNCGQTCLAPDYILCTEASKQKLATSFSKVLTEFYGKDIRNSKDYSRIINKRHFDRLASVLDSSKGKVLFEGGERDREDLFLPPYILNVEKSDSVMKDEIFGPILPIVAMEDLGEAIDYINQGEKPLAAYVFSKTESKLQRFMKEVNCGGITVNDVIMHITVDTLPFGGVGNSGMGRYRGKYGFDTLTHEKAVLKRGFMGESLQGFRYPPLTQQKLETMQRMAGNRIRFPNVSALLWHLPEIVLCIALGIVVQKYVFPF